MPIRQILIGRGMRSRWKRDGRNARSGGRTCHSNHPVAADPRSMVSSPSPHKRTRVHDHDGIAGKGVCGEYAYHPEGRIATASAHKVASEVPFKPAGRPKYGIPKTIGKLPEFLPEGSLEDLRKVESNTPATVEPWRPSSTYKTDCIRSIVRMNTH